MAYDIGPKIGIEGEAEYRRQLNQIIQTQKTLATEMGVVASSFDKGESSMESLTAQHKVLSKQVDVQKEKLEELEKGLTATKEKYGDTDTITLKWQQSVNKATADLNDMTRELEDNERAMSDFGNETDDVSDDLDNAAKSGISFGDVLKANILSDVIMSGMRALGGLIADAARELADFAKDGIETASDLQEVQNVVDTTFGANSGAIDSFAKSAASAFGMSELSAKQYSSTLGAMFKSMGLSDDAVLSMSEDLTGLAGDMASFYNMDSDEAFAKLRSGISGETEPLKQLGINMSQANLEAFALSEGIDTAYSSMTESEKATLRYQYIMQATADAQGDFAKTSDSYANQQRILSLNMENLGATIGGKFLPFVTAGTTALNDFLSGSIDSSEFANQLAGVVTDGVAAITDELPEIAKTGIEIVQQLLSGISENADSLGESAAEIITLLVEGLIDMLPDLADTGITLLLAIVQGIADNLDELVPAAVDAIVQLTLALISNMPLLVSAAGDLIVGLANGLIAAIPELLANAPEIIGSLCESLLEGVADIFDIGVQLIEGLWDGIMSMGSWLGEKISGFFSGILGGVKEDQEINSPSKVWADQIGKQMAAGVGVGYSDEMPDVGKDIQAAQDGLLSSMNGMATELNYSPVLNTSGSGTVEMRHSGTVRIEGVNSNNEFVGAAEVTFDGLVAQLKMEKRLL
jgi:hypothetical protein